MSITFIVSLKEKIGNLKKSYLKKESINYIVIFVFKSVNIMPFLLWVIIISILNKSTYLDELTGL